MAIGGSESFAPGPSGASSEGRDAREAAIAASGHSRTGGSKASRQGQDYQADMRVGFLANFVGMAMHDIGRHFGIAVGPPTTDHMTEGGMDLEEDTLEGAEAMDVAPDDPEMGDAMARLERYAGLVGLPWSVEEDRGSA